MKVLVFGSGGQLGQCFEHVSRQRMDRHYVFLDKEKFDITDPSAYSDLDLHSAGVFINCSAYTHVDAAESNQEQALLINSSGPAWMAEYCRNKKIPMIHFSTDYVYGPAKRPIREDHQIRPVNWYGQTKWEGEEYIRKSGAPHLIFRTAWLYSQYGSNFVRTMIRLAEDRDEISVVDDQTGSPTYAMDLAKAVDEIIHRPGENRAAWFDTYNFANRGAVSWYQFAQEILKDQKKVTVKPIPGSEYPTPAKRPTYSVLDVTAFENVFNYRIRDWKAALKECMGK